MLNVTALPLVLFEGAPARQLASIFGFDVSANTLTDLTSQASSWVGDAAGQVTKAAAGVAGLSSIVSVFNNAQGLLAKCLTVVQAAWKSVQSFGAQLMHIFTTFGPLKAVFASKDGLIELMTSMPNINRLVTVVQQLLGTSTVLKSLSGACRTMSDIFGQLSGVFKSGLSKLTGGGTRRLLLQDGRRLSSFSYLQLLQGIDFQWLIGKMGGFLHESESFGITLGQIQTTLGPLLATLQDKTQSRRLGSIVANQKMYSEAIKKIVPTWQGVEGMGMKLCPEIASSDGLSSSLKCRVAGFVSNQGALSALGGLLGSCPKTSTTPVQQSSCPATSLSSGVTDMLSQNAGILGWIIAGAVGLGLLGAGGGAFGMMNKGSGGGDSESDEERGSFDDSEQERLYGDKRPQE